MTSANLNKTADKSGGNVSTMSKSRLDAATNRTGGKRKKTASQSIMQSQIDETLRDVNDKVKDIVNSLRETKKALVKDYAEHDKKNIITDFHQQEIKKMHDKKMSKLNEPIKARKTANKTIKDELQEHLENYPQKKNEIPGLQRQEEKKHNVIFLNSVVHMLKIHNDPIVASQKSLGEVLSRAKKIKQQFDE